MGGLWAFIKTLMHHRVSGSGSADCLACLACSLTLRALNNWGKNIGEKYVSPILGKNMFPQYFSPIFFPNCFSLLFRAALRSRMGDSILTPVRYQHDHCIGTPISWKPPNTSSNPQMPAKADGCAPLACLWKAGGSRHARDLYG